MPSIPVLTIDGPSGAGKGTIARRLADLLGWHLLDSGALYRLLALAAEIRGIALDDDERLSALALTLNVEFRIEGETQRIFLDDEDVTDTIRTETVGAGASKVAAVPAVRQALLQRQRAFRQAPGLVADGRDMGTVVFPDAPLKVFLTASAEERARRRYSQLAAQQVGVDREALLREIEARDDRDMNRAVSPLKAADDAYCLDSTELTVDQVVELIHARWSVLSS